MRLSAAALAVAGAVACTVALSSPADAAARGVQVSFTEVPGTLATGDAARTVTVVASADAGRCRKVRWSMLVSVQGIGLDQVSLDRIEDDGAFPVRVESAGDTARITDLALDPGRLCRDRTVTARYRIAVDGDRAGRVSFQAQAFDAAGRLLEAAGGSSRVLGAAAPPATTRPPSPSPSPSRSAERPSPSPSATVSDEPSEGTGEPDSAAAIPPPADPGGPLSTDRAATSSGIPSLFGPGVVIGALLVFVGVGVLVRLRTRGGGNRRRTGRRTLPPHLFSAR